MNHRWTRRRFLQSSLAAGAAGLAGCPSTEEPGATPPGTLGSDGRLWGGPADATQASLLPSSTPDGILELFLLGGVSAYETFYCVPELNDPSQGGDYAGQGWWQFLDGPDGIEARMASCGGGDRPLLEEFGTDANGRGVHLGPWLWPLRERLDLVSRMRILVTRHDQFPHPGGNPIAMTGLRFGSPRMAGTASHIQRFFAERAPDRVAPFGHVLLPRNRHAEINNAQAGAALGLHRAAARPLVTWLADGQPLSQLLRREHLLRGTSAHDDLLELWGQGAADRLKVGGVSLRGPGLDDFEFARRTLRGHDALADLLSDAALSVGSGEACGEVGEEDVTATNLRLATHLLTHPEATAKYVLAVDGGLKEATGCLGYDTHFDHVAESSRNILHAMQELVDRINRPDEGDPAKIDLDRHAVVINTEFGRTPYRQGAAGTDHWPRGYVTVLLGGPIGPSEAGVVGAMDEQGIARDYVSPAELRAGLLLGMGIWPFQPEAFGVGDMRTGDTEFEAAEHLMQRVWGRTS